MRLSQVIELFLIVGFIGSACGVRFIDQNRSDIESVAKSICDLNKGTGSQIGRVDTIGSLVTYFKDLPRRHKLSACSNKYLDSIKELNELVSGRYKDVCSDVHLKKIEEFHKAYVSKISKHVKYRKANQLAAPWLLVMFFMHYASATSNYCEARAVEILTQEETGIQRSNDLVDVERLLKKFTETLGMKTELTQWNKDVFLIWNIVDNLPLESSKKFRKYLADGGERLFIRTREAGHLINLQKFCIKQKPVYEIGLLPLIRLADIGYFRAGESKLNKISSMRRHYMMIQMCETLLPIRVLEDDGALKPGQIVLVPVEEVKQVSQKKTSTQSRQFPFSEPAFSFTIDRETADVEINTFIDTVNYRGKTMNRFVKNMAKNVARKMKSKVGQLLVRDGKKNKDYASMMESSLVEIEKDDLDWSVLDDSPHDGRLIRARRGVGDFFKAWVDLAFNIIDGIAFTIGIVFLFAIKVALVFIVFIYKLGRSITGVGYRPIEDMFEHVWNGGFQITRKELDLTKNKDKFGFDGHHDHLKHSKHGVKHNGHHVDTHFDHHQHHQEPHLHYDNDHHHQHELHSDHLHTNPSDVHHYGPPASHLHGSHYPPPHPHNYPEQFKSHEHEEMKLKKSKSKSFFGFRH